MASATPASAVVPELWLTTSDHKRIGRMYLFFSVLFVLVTTGVGIALETSLGFSGATAVADNYSRLFGLHATAGTLLFLAPLWVGLATYVVPLQIGARRLAFPRMQALSLWTFVIGGALVTVSYIADAPVGAGITLSEPLSPVTGGAPRATDLWVGGLMLVTIASLLAAANLFVTILKLRAPGLTLGRLPAYAWSVLVSSVAVLLSAPAFVVGLLLVYLDQHFGGKVFVAGQVNANLVWQHLVWLYGRPDAYLLFLPSLGVISDVIATHARRPLFQPMAVKAAIFAFAVLSFGVLAANATAGQAVLLPLPTLLSAAVLLPTGLCALLWLATIRPQQLRAHISLLYVAGFVMLVLGGALNGVIAPSQHLSGGSAWTIGQLHAVLFGAPVLAAFAGIYHWAPKIWGRSLSAAVGMLQWACLFVGFAVLALGSWLAGYDGAPWHRPFAGNDSWLSFGKLSEAGGVLVALGLLLFVANLAVTILGQGSAAPDDPYLADSLEWATSSPPPEANFEDLPPIRSDRPLADARQSAAGGNE